MRSAERLKAWTLPTRSTTIMAWTVVSMMARYRAEFSLIARSWAVPRSRTSGPGPPCLDPTCDPRAQARRIIGQSRPQDPFMSPPSRFPTRPDALQGIVLSQPDRYKYRESGRPHLTPYYLSQYKLSLLSQLHYRNNIPHLLSH